MSLTVNSQLEYKLTSDLDFFTDIDFSLELGNATGAYSNVLVPERGIYLRELLLRKYFGNFHIGVGAINQGLFSSAILFHHSIFYGLYEKFVVSERTWNLHLFAQQSIPTAIGFSPDTRKQTTPLFFTYMANLELRASKLQFGANLAYFSFKNPSKEMANSSRFLGSTVIGAGLPGANFVYDFQGWILRGEISRDAMPFTFSLNTHFVRNVEAPDEKSDGWLLSLGLGFKKRDLELFSEAQIFRLESDYFPGIYSRELLGYSNRKGKLLSLKFKFPKEKFFLKATYVISDVVEQSLVQSDRSYLMFSFVKDTFSL